MGKEEVKKKKKGKNWVPGMYGFDVGSVILRLIIPSVVPVLVTVASQHT